MCQIAVLITSHNRRDKTVAALCAIDAAVKRAVGVAYHAFLTDDGSTDGTSDAVLHLGVPVTILQGSGDLYWNRGMIRSWEAALEDQRSFNGFLLLNDDTLADESAIAQLLEVDAHHHQSAIVVGAVRDPHTGSLTYGGVVRVSSRHPGKVRRLPELDRVQQADAFNANLVYVPVAVASAVGTLDPTFHHGIGDFDYGYRATQLGFKVVVAPGTLGTCPRNSAEGTWRDAALPVSRRLRLLESPKGLPRAQWFAFLQKHGASVPWLRSWGPTFNVLASGVTAKLRRVGSR